eukprot:tig00000147_g9453.t1
MPAYRPMASLTKRHASLELPALEIEAGGSQKGRSAAASVVEVQQPSLPPVQPCKAQGYIERMSLPRPPPGGEVALELTPAKPLPRSGSAPVQRRAMPRSVTFPAPAPAPAALPAAEAEPTERSRRGSDAGSMWRGVSYACKQLVSAITQLGKDSSSGSDAPFVPHRRSSAGDATASAARSTLVVDETSAVRCLTPEEWRLTLRRAGERGVTTVRLAACSGLIDSSLAVLAAKPRPLLTALSLSSCERVSPASLGPLLAALPNLIALDLEHITPVAPALRSLPPSLRILRLRCA